MKEINELMELSGKAYLKKFIIALVLMFSFILFEVVGFSLKYQQISLGVNVELSLTPIVVIYILILLYMHHRRFKKVLMEGSFTRIRLLPIKKMSFVYSELLYVGAIYTTMFLGVALAWVVGCVSIQHCTLAEFFYQFVSNDFLSSYFPYTFINVVKIITLLVMLTYGTVWLLMSSSDSDTKVSSRIVTGLLIFVSFLLNLFANTQGYGTSSSFDYTILSMIYIIEMLLIFLYAYLKLRKFFGRKEKRS